MLDDLEKSKAFEGLRPQIRGYGINLAEALMDMVNQHCYASAGLVDHGCLSSNEDALAVLEGAGLARLVNGRCYELQWEVLRAAQRGEAASAEPSNPTPPGVSVEAVPAPTLTARVVKRPGMDNWGVVVEGVEGWPNNLLKSDAEAIARRIGGSK